MAESTIQAEYRTSGTTNCTGIYWKRYGNVVTVIVSEPTVGTATITGLPIPAGNTYVVASLMNAYATGIVGSIAYVSWENRWSYSTTASSYGTLTYVCQ